MTPKQANAQQWEYFRRLVGIGLRCAQAIPADQLDSRPVKDMRSPKELVVHLFGQLPMLAEGVLRGEVLAADKQAIVAGIRTREDLLGFCSECWGKADRATAALTDTHLESMVKTPWDYSAPGIEFYRALYDEFLHHRGQLYAYLRQMGVTPPAMWDFENNPPEFAPRQAQPA